MQHTPQDFVLDCAREPIVADRLAEIRGDVVDDVLFTLQERLLKRTKQQIVATFVPQIKKQIVAIFCAVGQRGRHRERSHYQELVPKATVSQVVVMPVLQLQAKRRERSVEQAPERISKRDAGHGVDVPVPQLWGQGSLDFGSAAVHVSWREESNPLCSRSWTSCPREQRLDDVNEGEEGKAKGQGKSLLGLWRRRRCAG